MKECSKRSKILATRLSSFMLALIASTISISAQAEAEKKAPEAEQKQPISIEIVNGISSENADKEIIGALKKLLHALEQRSIEQLSACLSADVTTCDSKSGKALYGKEAVLEHIKKNVIGKDEDGRIAVKRLVVYDPYVRVKGETAMVSFRATKELGDGSSKLESWCSEVYERKSGDWLVLRLKTDWKPIKGK
ncbi:nuclear transport factor 2 family protein [bacterium]|nr:nuclear transport factor 2 family protein [bacterium]MBP9808611.1 nuclear transport factor 2 family protein [bacterium]